MKEKLKSAFKYIKLDFKYNYKYYICLLVLVLLCIIKLDYYVYCPGSIIDVSPRIKIEPSYESKGSFNMTYVSAKNGTIPVILLSYLIPSWDLVSIDDLRIENESDEDINERNKIYLKETSYDGIIAAFKEANLPYDITKVDLTVTYIYEMAKTNLKIGDIIKSINGVAISSFEELTNEISKYKENDVINIGVKRKDKMVESTSTLIKDEKSERIIIGVSLTEMKDIETTPKIEFVFKDSESGASRGLMCALEIYNRITEYDLTKGKVIAGTGTIDENGIVGSIDGVKYKLAGAVRKKAEIFIVPKDNYDEAIKLKEKHNYNISIISADTLNNVIKQLKEL